MDASDLLKRKREYRNQMSDEEFAQLCALSPIATSNVLEPPMPTHDPNHDPDTIWLAPACESNDIEGRRWCPDNVWDDNCGDPECNSKPTKYIRADIYEEAIESLCWIHDESCVTYHGRLNVGPMMEPSERAVLNARKEIEVANKIL